MALGSAKTKIFQVGTSELRVGTLSEANKMTAANSVGLVETVTTKNTLTTVKLEGGFPKTVVATEVASYVSTVEAVAYEYSRRNLMLMTGQGIAAASATFSTTATAALVAPTVLTGTSVLTVTGAATNFAIGDEIVVHKYHDTSTVQVLTVSAVAAGAAAGTVNLTFDNTKTPPIWNIAVGDIVFKALPVGLGITPCNRDITLEVIGQVAANCGTPIIQKYWKVNYTGDMTISSSADKFAPVNMSFEVLMPTADDVSATGALYGVRDLVAKYPLGMITTVG